MGVAIAAGTIGSAVVGGIFSGISSAMKARQEKKMLEMEIAGKKDMIGLEGHESRKTAMYGQLLGDWQNQKDRYRKQQGLANYQKFAAANTKPSSAHSAAMRGHQSSLIKDPGNMPDPTAMAARSHKDQAREDYSGYHQQPAAPAPAPSGSALMGPPPDVQQQQPPMMGG